MAANYAEIGRLGKYEEDLQYCPFVQIFWHFHIIVVKHQ